jgi:hypothetical protein
MSAALHPSSLKLRPSTPWTPTDRDRVIFQWVKFQGYTQSWVAEQLEISQSTVSRIVERYERWIARGGPGINGGLSHEEQLRYHRWLTIERNELIINSCLRIAHDMEHQIDVSRTTITRSNFSPSKEDEIKTYHEKLDRTAAAARFYRLAYRINMEQQKLRERTPLPDLEPLTEEEAAELLHDAQTIDLASGRREFPGNVEASRSELPPASRSEGPPSERTNPRVLPRPNCDFTEPLADVSGSPDPDTSADRQVSPAETTHTVHNHADQEPHPTPVAATASNQNQPTQKIKTLAYQDWLPPPEMSSLIPAGVNPHDSALVAASGA